MTQIPMGSPAVAHGIGLFETMLVTRGTILFLEEHLARMTRSAKALGFPIPDAARFREEAAQAVAGFRENEAALRCLHVAGGVSITDPWTFAAQCGPVPQRTLARRTHGRVATLDPSLTRALPEHKLTSYAPCVIGLSHAAAAGAEEGLFVTRDGAILEGTATNVFAVIADRVITAPITAGILPGITRAWVLAEATSLGIVIEERAPTLHELCAGSFLTGSLTGVVAVREVNGRACGEAGAAFEALAERWRKRIDFPPSEERRR